MQDLIQTKYKIWDYFQDKIACHSLFIHNPAKALEPNMINKAKNKTDTQPWHKEHDPEHHGERRIRSSYSRVVPEAEHGLASNLDGGVFSGYISSVPLRKSSDRWCKIPIGDQLRRSIPASDAKSSHFEIISVSTGDRRKLVGIYDRYGQQSI
jgi:hypothetical protein